jgi:hypothetical protein
VADDPGAGRPLGPGWTPIPDPTLLTSSLVEKARDDIRREIDFVRQILTQRLDKMDEAGTLLQEWRETLPRRLDEAMQCHKDVTVERFQRVEERFNVMLEKFAAMNISFRERDIRADQSSVSTKVAIDAALQAQKEMVASQNTNIAQALARIEATAQKQIEQLVTLLQTTTGGTNDKVDDLKQRLTLIEGRTAGITAAGTNQLATQQVSQGASGNVLAMIAIGLTLVGMVITIVVTILLNR